MQNDLVPLPLHSICIAYIELYRSMDIALRTQVDDVIRLNVSKQDCLQFFTIIEQVIF